MYYFDLTYRVKELVKMVSLREHILKILESSTSISTHELVNALNLIHKTYIFQGKFKLALDTLDCINMLVPSLPDNYDLNRIRMMIHSHADETSEDTEEYNMQERPEPMLDFTQIEKLNLPKLVMKETHTTRLNRSSMSEKSMNKQHRIQRAPKISDLRAKQVKLNDYQTLDEILSESENAKSICFDGEFKLR